LYGQLKECAVRLNSGGPIKATKNMPTRESHWFDKEIREAAEDYGLNPKIVEAVVLVESSGFAHSYRYEPAFWARYMEGKSQWNGANPRRVSASYGLMQVMFVVALELGFTGDPEELFQPRVGLKYGCLKLRALLLWSRGNVDAALAAYNGGKVGNAEPPYRNWTYVAKVHAKLAELDDHNVNA
jgi:soluble lytic murein transglycosylase-like protein